MSAHVLQSKPSAAAVFRLLPASLSDLLVRAGMSEENTRNAIKLLLVSKTAYCQGWTTDLQPIIAAGDRPNVARPTAQLVKYNSLERRRSEYLDKRQAYQAAYREANKDKRAAYNLANRETMNKKRNERMALKRAIAKGHLTAAIEQPVTTWRHSA